jgi:hypothetical protein
VRVQLSDGPPGVLAPIFAIIPPDASETTVPLRAAADAPVGAYDNLVVVASTTVKAQNINVQSHPARVEIRALPEEKPAGGSQ